VAAPPELGDTAPMGVRTRGLDIAKNAKRQVADVAARRPGSEMVSLPGLFMNLTPPPEDTFPGRFYPRDRDAFAWRLRPVRIHSCGLRSANVAESQREVE
jgi:hypothetical protein